MGIHSRNSFLAVLFWAVGVLSACGGGESSGPEPTIEPPAPISADGSPTEQPLNCPSGQVVKSDNGQRTCQASVIDPCANCADGEMCDSTGGEEHCAPLPMTDPANPCYALRELDGSWTRTDDHALSMTVTCVPDMDAQACIVNFDGRGSLADGAEVLVTDIPFTIVRGETTFTVEFVGSTLTQDLDSPNLTKRVDYTRSR